MYSWNKSTFLHNFQDDSSTSKKKFAMQILEAEILANKISYLSTVLSSIEDGCSKAGTK